MAAAAAVLASARSSWARALGKKPAAARTEPGGRVVSVAGFVGDPRRPRDGWCVNGRHWAGRWHAIQIGPGAPVHVQCVWFAAPVWCSCGDGFGSLEEWAEHDHPGAPMPPSAQLSDGEDDSFIIRER